MGPAGDAGHQSGQAHHPTEPAATGLGSRLPERDALHPSVHGASATQAGGEPGTSPAFVDRAGDGVPVRAVTPGLPVRLRLPQGLANSTSIGFERTARSMGRGSSSAMSIGSGTSFLAMRLPS